MAKQALRIVDGVTVNGNTKSEYLYVNNNVTFTATTQGTLATNGRHLAQDNAGKVIFRTTSELKDDLLQPGIGRVDYLWSNTVFLNILTDAQEPSQPTAQTVIYSKTAAGGGSGIYFRSDRGSGLEYKDELVSKKQAIVYGLIF